MPKIQKKTIKTPTEALIKKDKEIEELRNDLDKSKSNNQQLINDLTVQHLQMKDEMKDEVKDLKSKHNLLSRKNNKLTSQILAVQEKLNESTGQPKTIENPNKTPHVTGNEEPMLNNDPTNPKPSETYTIPVKNKFEKLGQVTNDQSPSELKKKQPKNQENASKGTTSCEQVNQTNTESTTEDH